MIKSYLRRIILSGVLSSFLLGGCMTMRDQAREEPYQTKLGKNISLIADRFSNFSAANFYVDTMGFFEREDANSCRGTCRRGRNRILQETPV